MKLFCLSGLGVDERAFVNFHPDGIELVHIPWIQPQKRESLKRMIECYLPQSRFNIPLEALVIS
ncbi:MAG: hypothetical protein A3D92_25300 [Bacteroidetes bacterium RIFCSPHIGHO2_02_FULL_44_7]|nr:MAG: hypothetical protein A3D92_25300 [Bacteroidetes bacterium RIFCSPHIGHO2_02_FULL_44_7]